MSIFGEGRRTSNKPVHVLLRASRWRGVAFHVGVPDGRGLSVSSPHFTNFIGNRRSHWLTRRVSQPKNNAVTAASLLFVIFLWGGNNAGTKWLVAAWPPIWTGGIRFLLAGLAVAGGAALHFVAR